MSDDNRQNWSADEWVEFLHKNDDKALLFIDGDSRIHEFVVDDETGQLFFLADGNKGYDPEGTRSAMESFAEDGGTAFKVVDKENVRRERKMLAEGDYETIADWTDHEAEGEGPDDAA